MMSLIEISKKLVSSDHNLCQKGYCLNKPLRFRAKISSGTWLFQRLLLIYSVSHKGVLQLGEKVTI